MSDHDQNPSDSAAGLVARLQAVFGLGQGEGAITTDTTTLRYCVYARKSTDTAEKQERSIGDQIIECRNLSERYGLRIVKVIHEERSAKTSDNRPLFREMIEGIIAGDYDAILTWAPDRLARNMKEAGEIVDLLDRGDIKDIKFANGFMFSNDPSGKMMLSIAFVMAKQYSDQHSQNVSRSIRRKAAEGKWPGNRSKHGYYIDRQAFLRPDGENHELIKQTFTMRVAKKSLIEIATFLREHGFPVKKGHNKHRKLVVNDKLVSDILHDPIYAGAMIYSGQIIDLFEKYDFVPAISVEDFDSICKLDKVKKDYKLTETIKPRGSIKADLMRGMVMCGHCMKPMSTGLTSKVLPEGQRHYYYFRCTTHGCTSKSKSVRAKVIMNGAYAFLGKHPLASEAGYKHYIEEMGYVLVKKGKEAQDEIKSLTAQKRTIDERIEDTKEQLRGETDALLVRDFKRDIREHILKSKELDAKLKKLKTKQVSGKDAILTLAEFVELFQNLASYTKKVSGMADLDFIMRKLFTNFTVKDGKVAQITQNSPFRELTETKTNLREGDSVLVTSPGVEPGLQA